MKHDAKLIVTLDRHTGDKLRSLIGRIENGSVPAAQRDADGRKFNQWLLAALNGWPLA